MGYCDPPKEHAFKKGQVANPIGGRAHDPHLKKLKSLTKAELIEVGNLVIKGNVEELKALAKSPNATVIQVMLAAVSVKIISKGDMHALDILLNRLVGKVKDEILQQMEIRTPQVIVTLPDNGRLAKQVEDSAALPESDDDYGF